MALKKCSILLLADSRRNNANSIHDHADAFWQYSRHDVYTYDPLGQRGQQGIKHLDFDEFDVVVLHYSVCILYDWYLHPSFKERIAKYQGLKIQFIQDDYRNVNSYMEVMRSLGIRILYTLCPPARIPQLWPEDRLPGVKKLTTLAGYVPDYLIGMRTPALQERPLDVGYRGRETPFWLGKLAREKVNIVKLFLEHAPPFSLKHDVSAAEADRLYGHRWPAFIKSCKTMLGSESGSSIADFDSSIEAKTRAYLKQYPKADFEEVHNAVLRPYEGNVLVNCVSPRAFETAALGTAMVLFPGEYSDVLRPWEHYIPLAKDFSNFPEVVSKILDTPYLQDLAQRAYEDLIASGRYSYRSFLRQFDDTVDAHATEHGRPGKDKYQQAIFEQLAHDPILGYKACIRQFYRRTCALFTRNKVNFP